MQQVKKLEFHVVQTRVVNSAERSDQIPDMVAAEIGGGLLFCLHGKKTLAFVPGVTLADVGYTGEPS